MTHTHPQLHQLLEETLNQCSKVERLDHDPLGLVHPYERPRDQEIAALFAATLAYGRVDLVRRAIGEALEPLGPRPADFIANSGIHMLETLWPDFQYRMTRRLDLVDLVVALHRTLQREGSLRALYARHSPDEGPVQSREDHLQTMSRWVQSLRQRRLRPSLHRGLRYLLVDPTDGSAAKRLHLYFRWMVRGPDGLDLGLWQNPSAGALIMPMDTHTSRLCRYLGLCDRKTVDNKMALEVTSNLARMEPTDPLRYDFALCHLGISERCIHEYSPPRCSQCPIEEACTLANPDDTGDVEP